MYIPRRAVLCCAVLYGVVRMPLPYHPHIPIYLQLQPAMPYPTLPSPPARPSSHPPPSPHPLLWRAPTRQPTQPGPAQPSASQPSTASPPPAQPGAARQTKPNQHPPAPARASSRQPAEPSRSTQRVGANAVRVSRSNQTSATQSKPGPGNARQSRAGLVWSGQVETSQVETRQVKSSHQAQGR